MRIANFIHQGKSGIGQVEGGSIVPIAAPIPPDLAAYLAGWDAFGGAAWTNWEALSVADVELLPPVPPAAKILCVASNFREDAAEPKPDPAYPLLFTRFADSLVGHGALLEKPDVTDRFDFEGELAVVIGRAGHRIAEREALAHVAGYTCFNDGSARDWQKHSSQFTPGKNFHRSGSCGPYLVTADEVGGVHRLALETRVNGVVKQRIGFDRFIFGIGWLISYISSFTPLRPGDVIATGTPSGFGSSRSPQEFLSKGDIVEVDIPGIGLLRNEVG